ncbi:hypothetical protein C8A01DRAFT_20742 [Parachaetomium inaequale]|uniref:Uncharacterized protein n=1 Tax=Parachaetomium inaequale TaxID=2588326 RepID=A0AAN6P874_9PEZI|nr:hypothetical protein C8A01DRAFT_20742 [Parachaetomium inaequale]
MLWQTTLVASFLAIGAQAGIGDLIVEGMSRNNQAVERRLEEIAKANLRARGYLETRQTEQGLGGNTPLKADGSLDTEAWNNAATTACQDALRSLHQATNPSGTCVCYNLPLLNNATGTFEADLRLFQLSEPTGAFQGIPQEQIEVELTYNGASVSEVNQQPVTRVKARQDKPGEDHRLLQSYLFVGQVDQDRMTGEVTTGQLQALVMPIVTLKATNGNGQQVTTVVSTSEAAFVAGEFSKDEVMSNYRLAELAVEAELAALKNGTVAFVLPGIQLMIFPIGLIITSVWLVLGLAAYGMGTYARYNFREAHKRRMAVISKGNVARF